MTKKIMALLLVLLLLCGLSACVGEERFDYSELEKRLVKINPAYAFNYENAFYSSGVYYIYYSFGAENNVLLTAREDEQQKLYEITLSVLCNDSDELRQAYTGLCEGVTAAFVPGAQINALLTQLKLYSQESIFSQISESTDFGRYKLSFFGSEIAACFVWQISEFTA